MNVFELFLMEGGEGGGESPPPPPRPPLKISPAYKEQSFPKGGLNSFLEKEGWPLGAHYGVVPRSIFVPLNRHGQILSPNVF